MVWHIKINDSRIPEQYLEALSEAAGTGSNIVKHFIQGDLANMRRSASTVLAILRRFFNPPRPRSPAAKFLFFFHQNSFWVSPLHDQHRRDIRPLVTLVWILFFCTYFRLASRTFTQHLPCHNTKRISAHVDVISKLISSCHLLQLEWNLLFSGRAIGPRLFFLGRKVR